MSLEPQNAQLASQADQRYKKLSIPVTKAAIAALVVAGVVTSGVFYASGTSLLAANSGDNISESNQKSRLEAFQAISYFTVSKVSPEQIQSAIDSMHLAPDQQSNLRVRLTPGSAPSRIHPQVSRDNATASAVHASANATPEAPAQTAAALPQATPISRAAPQVLVWVHLWDSDVEDGDVVRVDSAGYSRTVTLTRSGITFAVPVSASGQIRIAGIRDGDGGGITVGLGSGSTQAILPVMSVGQVLTLNVRTN
jgi:hypothetical protein